MTVTMMICLVWFLSALVSMPLLGHFPFRLPEGSEIILTLEDRDILDQINATQVFAHSRCLVSFFNLFFNKIECRICIAFKVIFTYEKPVKHSHFVWKPIFKNCFSCIGMTSKTVSGS